MTAGAGPVSGQPGGRQRVYAARAGRARTSRVRTLVCKAYVVGSCGAALLGGGGLLLGLHSGVREPGDQAGSAAGAAAQAAVFVDDLNAERYADAWHAFSPDVRRVVPFGTWEQVVAACPQKIWYSIDGAVTQPAGTVVVTIRYTVVSERTGRIAGGWTTRAMTFVRAEGRWEFRPDNVTAYQPGAVGAAKESCQ